MTLLSKLRTVINRPQSAIAYSTSRLSGLHRVAIRGNVFEALWYFFTICTLEEVDFYGSYLARKYGEAIWCKAQGNWLCVDSRDTGVSREVVVWNVHEPEVTHAFREQLRDLYCQKDDIVVIDCGANIGYYAFIEAAELGPDSTIYAIEPVPRNLKLLEKAVQKNEYEDRVEVVEGAFSDETGEQCFHLSKESNRGCIGGSPYAPTGDTLVVDAWTVDRFLSDYGLSPGDIDVIRMDVEGYEASVFRGMSTLLSSNTPLILFVEVHDKLLKTGRFDWFVDTLKSAGFSIKFGSHEPVGSDLCGIQKDRIENYDELKEALQTWENVEIIFVRE